MLKRKITCFLSTVLIVLSLSGFDNRTVFASIKPNAEKNKNEYTCKYGQCQATAKNTGKQCKHCVSNSGDSYCWQHK